ncbi:MAG: leucine efflux protein LeuE [Proteobacteria bacterium]|nr:leucine efflux protein LeuE [Pseudomonadota bacterium]
MDLGIHSFLEFAVGTVIIVVLPGPNSLYVITASARLGERAGWRAAGGILTGDTILMVATAAGAASMMTLFPTAFALMKVVGALYLGWIGLQLLRDGWQRWRNSTSAPVVDPQARTQAVASSAPSNAPSNAPFWKALGLSLTNPKAILFFIAFLTQFVRADAPSAALAYLSLGVVVQVVSLSYLVLLIYAGLRLQGAFAAHPRWAASGIFLVSLCFLGFAASILLGA